MSTKVQVKPQTQTPTAPGPVPARQPPVVTPGHEPEQPDLATQLQATARMGHSLGAIRVDGAAPPIFQRQELPEEEEELQMKRDSCRVGPEGGPVPPDVEAAIQSARGGGQPLDGAIQAQMGERLGHDFGTVRVHTDAEADALNQQLSARAFTTGRDIFFRHGEYRPGSGSGREVLAHELTHVVQQAQGRVRPTQLLDGEWAINDDGRLEQEADVMGKTAATMTHWALAVPVSEADSPQDWVPSVTQCAKIGAPPARWWAEAFPRRHGGRLEVKIRHGPPWPREYLVNVSVKRHLWTEYWSAYDDPLVQSEEANTIAYCTQQEFTDGFQQFAQAMADELNRRAAGQLHDVYDARGLVYRHTTGPGFATDKASHDVHSFPVETPGMAVTLNRKEHELIRAIPRGMAAPRDSVGWRSGRDAWAQLETNGKVRKILNASRAIHDVERVLGNAHMVQKVAAPEPRGRGAAAGSR